MKTSHILQRYYLFLNIEREIETCLDAQISLSTNHRLIPSCGGWQMGRIQRFNPFPEEL